MSQVTDERLRLSDYEVRVARLYDEKQQDFNYLLGSNTDLIHHHFGLGTVLPAGVEGWSEVSINQRLHELENAQVERLIHNMGGVKPHDRVFDGGSGRGGTAILLQQRHRCIYHGATISRYQCEFSRQLARRKGYNDRMFFYYMNMLRTDFADGYFDFAITNETTMYIADLEALYAEFRRIVRPGGKYVMMTWCIDESCLAPGAHTRKIDEHYVCGMHTRGDYLRALVHNDFIPYAVADLTPEAVPYWQLRIQSKHRTGVEQFFIDGYAEKSIMYLAVAAQLLPKGIACDRE